MAIITRKGIAFEKDQLAEFDRLIKKRGYTNRSEAIRDLIRDELVEEKKNNPEETMLATLTFIYNHHDHGIQHKLTDIQHKTPGLVRSSMHTHIDAHSCLEVLILEGKVKHITKLADSIISSKGVRHGKLVLTGIC